MVKKSFLEKFPKLFPQIAEAEALATKLEAANKQKKSLLAASMIPASKQNLKNALPKYVLQTTPANKLSKKLMYSTMLGRDLKNPIIITPGNFLTKLKFHQKYTPFGIFSPKSYKKLSNELALAHELDELKYFKKLPTDVQRSTIFGKRPLLVNDQVKFLDTDIKLPKGMNWSHVSPNVLIDESQRVAQAPKHFKNKLWKLRKNEQKIVQTFFPQFQYLR